MGASTGALALAAGAAATSGGFFAGAEFLARRDALVLVLHVGFGLASAGFLFAGAHGLSPTAFPHDAAVHAWAIGGAATMTSAMIDARHALAIAAAGARRLAGNRVRLPLRRRRPRWRVSRWRSCLRIRLSRC